MNVMQIDEFHTDNSGFATDQQIDFRMSRVGPRLSSNFQGSQYSDTFSVLQCVQLTLC